MDYTSNPIVRSIDLTETFHKEVDEELDDDEKKEVEEQNRENELRRTDYAAYQKLVLQKSIHGMRSVGGFPRPTLSSQLDDLSSSNLIRKEPFPSTPTPGLQMNVDAKTFSTPMSDGSRNHAHKSNSAFTENPAVSLTGLRPELGSQIQTESPAAPSTFKPQSGLNIPHRSISLGTSTASAKKQLLRRSRITDPQASNISPHDPHRGDPYLTSTSSSTSLSFTNPSLPNLSQLSRDRATADLYKALYSASLTRDETLNDRAPTCWRSAEIAEGKLYRRAKSEAAYRAMVQSVIKDSELASASKEVTGRGYGMAILQSTDAKSDPDAGASTTTRPNAFPSKTTHYSETRSPSNPKSKHRHTSHSLLQEPKMSKVDPSPSANKDGVGNIRQSPTKLSPFRSRYP